MTFHAFRKREGVIVPSILLLAACVVCAWYMGWSVVMTFADGSIEGQSPESALADLRQIVDQRIAGLVSKSAGDEAGRVRKLIFEATMKQTAFSHESRFDPFFVFDASAKKALYDFSQYFYDTLPQTPLPLWTDQSVGSEVCVGVFGLADPWTGPMTYLVQTVMALLVRDDMLSSETRGKVSMTVFTPPKSRKVLVEESDLLSHLLPVVRLGDNMGGGDNDFSANTEQIVDALSKRGCKHSLVVDGSLAGQLATLHWLTDVRLAIASANKGEWKAIQFTPGAFLFKNGIGEAEIVKGPRGVFNCQEYYFDSNGDPHLALSSESDCELESRLIHFIKH